MTEIDKRPPGLYRAPPEEIPPFREAVAQYKDPAKQALVETINGGNDLQWDYWKVTIEYGHRAKFESILDFFINLPSLQTKFGDESLIDAWYWNEIKPVTLANKFSYRPELIRLLRSSAGPDAMIRTGWLVKHVAGRIDTETTWTDTSYLIETNGYYAYIQLYLETIH